MLLLVGLVQAAIAQSCPPPPPSKGPKVGLFSYEDYPSEAVRNHWQGTVIADLTISPDGRVSACRIIQSSGHKVLDDATCGIMSRRAFFTPARDNQCNPIESTYRTPPIQWRLWP
jgi:protein TonB